MAVTAGPTCASWSRNVAPDACHGSFAKTSSQLPDLPPAALFVLRFLRVLCALAEALTAITHLDESAYLD